MGRRIWLAVGNWVAYQHLAARREDGPAAYAPGGHRAAVAAWMAYTAE